MLGERAPAWELNEAGRQVGVLAGPEYSGQAGQDPREDWNWTQDEGQQVDNNLLEDKLMNEIESAQRMEECRPWSYGAPWSKPPNSTFREPESRIPRPRHGTPGGRHDADYYISAAGINTSTPHWPRFMPSTN